ncbi:hypothetical protein BRADI_1g37967v3 [Brachypodium distachyon]|uniref:EXS domain-containing protein n=1 Tax=Brachypodium distachyon TaxID=15368 RepID=A0A2K2DND2_BRADI|nr:hypothetical protein BRADI_1g37967v3 [Brachypodium distachyon]PNT75789.1 hypothetical protein BRADI_1g37967v3 [Brachypodium distachyon]
MMMVYLPQAMSFQRSGRTDMHQGNAPTPHCKLFQQRHESAIGFRGPWTKQRNGGQGICPEDQRVSAETQAPRLRAQRLGVGGEMKGASVPAVVIMPSPIFLWRFKAILFLLWGLCCCKIGWDSVMRMSVDLRDLFLYEAFLYYNPLLLVALMIWLWGVNLWVFAQSSVNYVKVFDLAQTHLSHREMWRVLLYAILLMILLSPFDMFYLSSRFYFLRTVWRIILPLQAITFPDFFLADIFTSMSKVFSDLERSVCRMVNRQVATIAWFEADSICGSHSIAIPLVLVLPYLCRFFQCLRQYKDTKEKTCLLNGVLLGVRQQSRPPLYMDIQAFSASAAQLPDSVCDNSFGNGEAVSMGLFPCRE